MTSKPVEHCKHLKDPEIAAAYLEEALLSGDQAVIVHALNQVKRALKDDSDE